MLKCSRCQTENPDDARYCANRGTQLTARDFARGVSPSRYGSFWRRFGGFLIDAIILGVVGGIIGLIVSPNASSVIGIGIGLVYYVGLNANGGTLGKRAIGLRLEDAETGQDIGYPRALVRYIVAIASGLVLLLGYLWCIWDHEKQTWHDKAAGSIVVRT